VHAATPRPRWSCCDTPAPTGEITETAAEGSFLDLVTTYDRHRRTGEPLDERLAGMAFLTELAAVADWMSETGQGDPFALLAVTLDAVERHRPDPYPGPVVVCGAAETDFGTGTSFESGYARHRTDSLGWDALCARLAVHLVPGNHVSMLTGANAGTLARTVSEIVRHHHGGPR
jgi:thioesterase domain-containing protein